MKLLATLCLLASLSYPNSCSPDTDDKQSEMQAKSLAQAHEKIGMPSLNNFQEKRMAKDIYELRDQSIATHAYIVNELNGCLVYLGPAVGYGLPYATQYSAPTTQGYERSFTKPQAEPNGLFMPAAAEGTWVLLKDPGGDVTKPVYIEPRVIVAPFRLADLECPKAKK